MIGPVYVSVCVSVCGSVTKNFAKEPFRQKDGLYATCRNTFMFMCFVVPFGQLVVFFRALPRVIARVLRRIFPCEIAA